MSVFVTTTDCLRCGFCPSGIKSWCDSHGVETRDFLKHGLSAERTREIGDAFGLRALAEAERRVARGR